MANVWTLSRSPRRRTHRWRNGLVVVGASLTLLPLAAVPASAAPPGAAAEADIPAPDVPELPPAVPEEERDATLGPHWDTNGDRAWITSGDAEGLHLFTADAASGYEWQEIASLTETGFVTDMWIGNACLTGSGQRLAVTYAPRSFTNDDALFDRGGFTALIDLDTGAVTKLDLLSSLAYYSPGCGVDETVLFTQEGGELGRTRIVSVDAAAGTVMSPIEVSGQLTSAVPTPAGIVAADEGALVRVAGDGARTPLVQTQGTAFELAADGEGGVVFMEAVDDQAEVSRLRPDQAAAAPPARLPEPATLGSGDLTDVGIAPAADGQVYITGAFEPSTQLPAAVHDAEVAKDAEMSAGGQVAVTATVDAAPQGPANATPEPGDPTEQAEDVAVHIESLATGETAELVAGISSVSTAAATGPSPALRAVSLQGSPSDPVDAKDERYCSVPLNDPASQALQPKPRQVEWAVDQAVMGALTASGAAKAAVRSGAYIGIPDWHAQAMFPPAPLAGGAGKHVPPQIMLGILAQESNLWQAPGYVVPGVTGSPLVGNFYGLEVYNKTAADDFTIDWSEADCGYGVAQVTDGMRLAGKEGVGKPAAYSEEKQRAVALDYVTNIAAGLRILQDKWNQTYNAGLRVNNADPAKIENWFYAVWAYNSGFYPQSAAAQNDGAWGVGWANNPANPRYPANRSAFLDITYADAKTPQNWPYPEKVMGWAGHPIDSLESPDKRVAGYRPASWNGSTVTGAADNANTRRSRVKPPVNQFCDASNSCSPGQRITPTAPEMIGEPAGPCAHKDSAGRYDLKCWANTATTWKSDCAVSCGNELLRFDPGFPYEPDGTAYPPNCSRGTGASANGLPSNALVVDDVPSGTTPSRKNCTPVRNEGSFTLDFGNDAQGAFPSKTDFHQLGAGFNGHFWFAHTREPLVRGGSMNVTGTWTLNQSIDKWARVLVHMPDHGAHTQQAAYVVHTATGDKTRVVPQRTQANKWVSLGVFQFNGQPRVTLSSDTFDGDPDSTDPDNAGHAYQNEDIAFDAVAFQPLAAKPSQFVVSMGDSYSSGEGASVDGGKDYYPETDNNGDSPRHQNACHRSPYAWSRLGVLADSTKPIGQRADEWDPTLDYNMVACSGATTTNLLPRYSVADGHAFPVNPITGERGRGQFGELSQIDRGFLDENTTLVTISIGGNDARFADVLNECINPLANGTFYCYEASFPESDRTVEEDLLALLPGVEDAIFTALQEIHTVAPNAKILLMGYPMLMEDRGSCVLFMHDSEGAFINGMSGLLSSRMHEAAQRVDDYFGEEIVTFRNPGPQFAGQGVCGSPETIHGLIAPYRRTPGETPSNIKPSNQSFHPKIDGQSNYARAFNAALSQLGM